MRRLEMAILAASLAKSGCRVVIDAAISAAKNKSPNFLNTPDLPISVRKVWEIFC